MRRPAKRVVCGILAIVMIAGILCTSTSAATYSSEYLNSYSASVLPTSNGVVVVSARVSGCGSMDEIGVKTVFLYESQDGKNFQKVATYSSTDHPEMMGSGIVFYRELFRYAGKVGYCYYASAYVYAGKGGAGDTRNYVTAMIQATV